MNAEKAVDEKLILQEEHMSFLQLVQTEIVCMCVSYTLCE